MLDPVHGAASTAELGGPPSARASSPLSRALAEAVGQARDALAVTDAVTSVHDMRKAIKRLRALLRLVRLAGAPEERAEARALGAALGAAARRLSGARDAAARREALDDLAGQGLIAPAVRRAAGRAITPPGTAEGETGLDPHRDDLVPLIERCAARAVPLADALGTGAVLDAIARDYARARRLVTKVDPADPESLHELRKAVIAHRYQMELVSEAWPALGALWVDELQQLRDRLGKHQDVAVLQEHLDALPQRRRAQPAGKAPVPAPAPAPDWRAVLAEAVRLRQAKLVRSALRQHARLFVEKPKAFRRRLAAYFDPVSDRE